MSFDELIQGWGGNLSCSRFDPETGTFFTIAVDSLLRGPAAGGTRAMVYPGFEAAVEDATRLASAMTLKMAIAGLPMGGGTSVIALTRPRSSLDDRSWKRILGIHAENLATLGGSYWTGPDVGTSSEDMDELHAASGFAFGRSAEAGGPGSSAPETAHGVYVAVRTAAREAGIDDLAGSRVLVQGLGAVGMDVARRVVADGAELVATDVDPGRCQTAALELGAEIIDPHDSLLDTVSDIFVPCATGAVIDDAVAREIKTRVVAGAANNVLSHETAADELARRGVVLAPDFVANGGGAIHLVGREILGWTADQVSTKVDAIATTLTEVFALAKSERISTETAARRLAEAMIADHH